MRAVALALLAWVLMSLVLGILYAMGARNLRRARAAHSAAGPVDRFAPVPPEADVAQR
jgi:hypothetical protein